MIEREDGPIKHYRLKCDKCGKETKRYAWGLDFTEEEFPGWKESGDEDEPEHFCPKCAGNPEPQKVNEIVKEVGNKTDLSDHEEVAVVLSRETLNTLVIDIGNGSKLVITSESPIKAEQHDE